MFQTPNLHLAIQLLIIIKLDLPWDCNILSELTMHLSYKGTHCQIPWLPVWILYPRDCDVHVYPLKEQPCTNSPRNGKCIWRYVEGQKRSFAVPLLIQLILFFEKFILWGNGMHQVFACMTIVDFDKAIFSSTVISLVSRFKRTLYKSPFKKSIKCA